MFCFLIMHLATFSRSFICDIQRLLMLMPVAIWMNINGPGQQEEVGGQGGQVD